jgi:hypothetical protein
MQKFLDHRRRPHHGDGTIGPYYNLRRKGSDHGSLHQSDLGGSYNEQIKLRGAIHQFARKAASGT